MLPALQDQQMWYGDPCEDSTCRNSIQRGDIIVFDTKNPMGQDDTYVKRVIGVPLDHITLANGNVYVNDYLLIEPYISGPTATNTSNACQTYLPASNQIFVLGDNRSHSHDSRSFGPVDMVHIWGISRFEKYNSIESLPKLNIDMKLQMDERECPVWEEH